MMERAAHSLPSSDGMLSAPMVQVLNDANVLGIRDLALVGDVENAFKCISWCCFAMPILAKRPSLQEVSTIVSKGAGLKLPEERPMRMIKSMAQRAKTWQNKAVKALAPKPNETEPVNVNALKSLVQLASDIPLSIPGENCVQNVIDDKGARYCICGGPHFGSFMLGCDKCERWYHGRCVHVSSKEGDSLENWLCPPCRGVPYVGPPTFSAEHFDYTDDEAEDDETADGDNDKATSAPDPEKLWPPFGLLRSEEALSALGPECLAIPDDTASLTAPSFAHFSNAAPAAPAPYTSLLNGVSLQTHHLMNAFSGYTFGGNLSNGGEAASVKPLFGNALAERASSVMSSDAALTSSHGFQALAATAPQEAADNGASSGGAAHGFHGIAASLGSTTNGFHGFASASREASSSTNASSENLGSTSASPVEGVCSTTPQEEESKPSPPMNWQPAILNAASSADLAGVVREHATDPAGLQQAQALAANPSNTAQNGTHDAGIPLKQEQSQAVVPPVMQNGAHGTPPLASSAQTNDNKMDTATTLMIDSQSKDDPMDVDPPPEVSLTTQEHLVEIQVQDKAA